MARKKIKVKNIIAIALAIVLALIFIVYPILLMITSGIGLTDEPDPRFSAYDETYSDISRFKEDVELLNFHVQGSIWYDGNKDHDGVYDYKTRSIISTPTLLLGDMIDPKDTIYIAIGIEKPYSQEEIHAIENFLARGGHAVIADDFGNANQLAKDFGVTFFGGQFYDENFDKNANYTVVKAHLGSDLYDKDWEMVWTKEEPHGDGVWDDDQDADGKIDEDDDQGSSRNYDDDRDNARLQKDARDNDNDGNYDEENEGIDEDPINDDRRISGEEEKWQTIHPNVDIEFLDGKNNDPEEKRSLIDEDLQSYQLITYKPTGLSSSVNPWIWAAGSSKSFIDMDDNGILSIPKGDLEGKNADEVSSVGNEIQVIIELPVADDGSGAVDIISGEAMNTIDGAEKSDKTYRVREQNPDADKYITELGSIVFISDPSMFMNDLYELNHISYDINLPWDWDGNLRDDDMDGFTDEDREILFDTQNKENDGDNFLDNTPDYWTTEEIEKFSGNWPFNPWLSNEGDGSGPPKYDYDNAYFLMDLIRHLCPAEQGETNLILIDESRHDVPNQFLKPVYKSMKFTGFVTSSPYYAYPLIASIGFLMIFGVLLIKDKQNWAHNFDISHLYPRSLVPSDTRLQTTKLRIALREKIRLIRGLSPEEFSTLNEKTIYNSIKDPELIEMLQNTERSYTAQEIRRMMEKIKKIQSM